MAGAILLLLCTCSAKSVFCEHIGWFVLLVTSDIDAELK